MQRREFLKGSCRICLLGAAGFAVALEACSPKAGAATSTNSSIIVKDKIATVPLINLKENKAINIISINKYPYEIAIEKNKEGKYKALLLMCTHYENQLTPTGNGYTCSAHGSTFTNDGKVTKGPAEEPLKELKTTLTENNLMIQLI